MLKLNECCNKRKEGENMNKNWTGFNREGLSEVWRHFKLFLKVSTFGIVGVFVYCWMTAPSADSFSVLTEVGKAKEAEYQEWKEQEDEDRLQERKEKRFRERYKNER